MPRLFLDRHRLAARIELDHAIGFGVAHLISENSRSRPQHRRPLKGRRQTAPVEDIVPEHQRDMVVADEVPADQKGLREPLGARLLGITERYAPLTAILEQPLEAAAIHRRGYDEDVADARQQQCRQRVIDHRLVVDRQQLLADRQGDRVQPGAGTAGEDDPLHRGQFPVNRSRGALNGWLIAEVLWKISQHRVLPILVRQYRLSDFQRPDDTEGRIVPEEAAIMIAASSGTILPSVSSGRWKSERRYCRTRIGSTRCWLIFHNTSAMSHPFKAPRLRLTGNWPR